MTNLERWRLIFRDVPTPDSYIDFGFYYLIAASLQRRVWVAGKRDIFPNLYIFLVGEPGIGKNWITEPVEEMLKFHKKEGRKAKAEYQHLDAELQEAIAEAERVSEELRQNKKTKFEHQLLIPIAADATTYEALTGMTAASIRRMNYPEWSESLQKNVMGTYVHSSIAFCLKELSSLFQENKNALVNFLITAYDCGDYSYVTKNSGSDYIQKMCVNILGGTTPSFIRKTFNDSLLTEGFASRSIFIFESENRFERIRVPELNREQREAEFVIRNHIKKLTTLYGKIIMSEEAWDFTEDWWKNNKETRTNKSEKLQGYYSRKNIHAIKLAIAIHFGGDDLTFTISKEEIIQALSILEVVEQKMHIALEFDGRNPLAKVARKVEEYLRKTGPKTTEELIAVFFDDCSVMQLRDVLQFLLTTKRILNEEQETKQGKIKSVWIAKSKQEVSQH